MTALTPQPGANPGLPCIARRRLLAASPMLLVASTSAGDAVASPGAALEAPDVADLPKGIIAECDAILAGVRA